MLRRELLTRTGLALAAGAIGSPKVWSAAAAPGPASDLGAIGAAEWNAVRAQFALSDEFIHMSAMLISSHPKPVREAIEQHRRAMDANPLTHLFQNNRLLQEAARAAAGQYLGSTPPISR